ncbi:MAG: hypothetical protein R6X08_12955 [Desulfosalsimonadaceae bacterium]
MFASGWQLWVFFLSKNDNPITHGSFQYVVFKEHSCIASASCTFFINEPLAMIAATAGKTKLAILIADYTIIERRFNGSKPFPRLLNFIPTFPEGPISAIKT